MASRKQVAVIGGGVSGLAAAKAFDQKGRRVVCFERSHDFGGVWEPSRSYPDLQTQSPKELYCFTDQPMPDDYPEWPKGPQVPAYLHSYAQKQNLSRLFRLNTQVSTVQRRADGKPGWTLSLVAGSHLWEEHFDFVAVSTGRFSEKNILVHHGQDAFTANGGQIMHSSEYTDPSLCGGKHIVVLGGSKSATDIAVNAARNGAATVTMVYRENVWRVPYFIGGINFKHLLYIRVQEQQFNSWGLSPLKRFVRAVFKPLVWANFRGLQTLLKLQLGLKKHGMVPDSPIEKQVSCSAPIVTPGLIECLNSGQIRPIIGTIESYEDKSVRLSTGEVLDCDVSILAVGWKLGVTFIAPKHQQQLIEEDGQYRAYRLAVNPELPQLGFVGFNSSFCTMLSAEMIANWLVRYADGMLANQPDDELLADRGATRFKRRNPLAKQFSYPCAQAYGEYLASTPQYEAQ